MPGWMTPEENEDHYRRHMRFALVALNQGDMEWLRKELLVGLNPCKKRTKDLEAMREARFDNEPGCDFNDAAEELLARLETTPDERMIEVTANAFGFMYRAGMYHGKHRPDTSPNTTEA